ncbi:MAG TPA: WYL domain-containing protein [Leptospiraceae bacterium]|nr:WYL domain-containing protein [Leptospiraceae bacterium]HMY69437.1 WYL domain-containing protein [Leptospiraceae bacterium]HNF17134.1 WYL domain-containing protein [Leptospiraceae bacterium]HNF27438.1 WYL domain-containing protein [Leptospiraceae bacterium]HNH08306.1 WYL domain-containing protein [Leptospiraceae bacterium]
MNSTRERLEKKLALIQIISSNPQIGLDDLQEIAKFESKLELKKNLGELFMVGMHPYTPADYIEVEYDGNGLDIRLPVNLEKTIGLNIQEWVILRKLLDNDDIWSRLKADKTVLNSLKKKIAEVVSYSEFLEFESVRERIYKAIAERKKIRFSYKGHHDSVPENRETEPWFIFGEKTQYLVGYSSEKKGMRNFRLDSMNDLEILNEPISFEPDEMDKENHMNSFFSFINEKQESSEWAEIAVLPSAHYNLSKELSLGPVQGKIALNGKEYFKFNAKIIEKSWFLNIVKGYGESVFVLSPDSLTSVLANSLDTVQIPELGA